MRWWPGDHLRPDGPRAGSFGREWALAQPREGEEVQPGPEGAGSARWRPRSAGAHPKEVLRPGHGRGLGPAKGRWPREQPGGPLAGRRRFSRRPGSAAWRLEVRPGGPSEGDGGPAEAGGLVLLFSLAISCRRKSNTQIYLVQINMVDKALTLGVTKVVEEKTMILQFVVDRAFFWQRRYQKFQKYIAKH